MIAICQRGTGASLPFCYILLKSNMVKGASTVDVSYFQAEHTTEAVPGLVVVFQAQKPIFGVHPLVDGEIEVGRAAPGGISIDDRAMSRRHARVSLVADRFEVEDLGSRNGLVVDGVRVDPGQSAVGLRTLRLGETVLLFCADVRPLRGKSVEIDNGVVIGPQLRDAWNAIGSVATSSSVLHLRGESGVGKELAAEHFHAAISDDKETFVAVNCAAIPQGVAERLLFGAKKGAFSGAHADATGLIEAANKGTLFLDEIGELELDVQGKLLRVLETHTVMPIGDVRARAVDFRVVSATHQDLRSHVSDKKFREDLFYRLGRPEVVLPPLRDRAEEISYLAGLANQDGGLPLSAGFIEACLLRPWPGNVRELILEAKEAGRQAAFKGASAVQAEHLGESAGLPHVAAESPSTPAAASSTKASLPEAELIEAALRESKGKVATAARQLGVHRNQLRRWLSENNIDPTSFG
jgi:transcriptional regulator of acetoin/glycerol metabolism